MRIMFVPLAFFAAALTIVPAAGDIETIAGTGKKGLAPIGAKAGEAPLNQPFHCEIDDSGNLIVVDTGNHRVVRLDLRSGLILNVAGNGEKGYAGDGGRAGDATLNEPYAAVVDRRNGTVYIADRLNAVVRAVHGEEQTMTTIAGNGKKDYAGDGKLGIDASFREPNDCFIDNKNGLLIADVADWRVRRLDLKTGLVSTFAGVGRVEGKIDRTKIGDGGPATKAVVVGARAVCADPFGNVYICEREGNAIRRVDARGIISTFAGTGAKGYAGDGGPASRATFNGPKGIRCDKLGNLYVVDTENHAVRMIDAKTRIVRTVAGIGKKGFSGDGEPAIRAALNRPHGCVVDSQGNLYIADTENHRVRKVAKP